MSASVPTRGQLERKLSQLIQSLYTKEIGHQPSKIICQLSDKSLTIILEDSITQPEQLLAQQGQDDLAKEVRSNLDEALKPKLQEVVESVLAVKAIDILSNATLDTGRTGIVVVLESAPKFREPAAKAKPKSEK